MRIPLPLLNILQHFSFNISRYGVSSGNPLVNKVNEVVWCEERGGLLTAKPSTEHNYHQLAKLSLFLPTVINVLSSLQH